jgi:hypothetical protein
MADTDADTEPDPVPEPEIDSKPEPDPEPERLSPDWDAPSARIPEVDPGPAFPPGVGDLGLKGPGVLRNWLDPSAEDVDPPSDLLIPPLLLTLPLMLELDKPELCRESGTPGPMLFLPPFPPSGDLDELNPSADADNGAEGKPALDRPDVGGRRDVGLVTLGIPSTGPLSSSSPYSIHWRCSVTCLVAHCMLVC